MNWGWAFSLWLYAAVHVAFAWRTRWQLKSEGELPTIGIELAAGYGAISIQYQKKTAQPLKMLHGTQEYVQTMLSFIQTCNAPFPPEEEVSDMPNTDHYIHHMLELLVSHIPGNTVLRNYPATISIPCFPEAKYYAIISNAAQSIGFDLVPWPMAILQGRRAFLAAERSTDQNLLDERSGTMLALVVHHDKAATIAYTIYIEEGIAEYPRFSKFFNLFSNNISTQQEAWNTLQQGLLHISRPLPFDEYEPLFSTAGSPKLVDRLYLRGTEAMSLKLRAVLDNVLGRAVIKETFERIFARDENWAVYANSIGAAMSARREAYPDRPPCDGSFEPSTGKDEL